MVKFIGKRILAACITVFLLSIVIFVIAHMTDGDPAQIILGAEATEEQLAELRSEMGIDRPLLVQYTDWITSALRGDLGYSYYSNLAVTEEIQNRLAPSLTLAICAELLAVLIAIPAGVFAARYRGKIADYLLSSVSLLGLSIPNFLVSLFLILIFGVSLKLLPVSGYRTIGEGFGTFARYTIMPVVALALGQAGLLVRMTRSSMLEVMGRDYIKTVKAKGTRQSSILFKHGLRNAFIPVLTVIGQSFGTLLAGTAIVETIFNIPGVGQFIVTSITRRDYAMIQGIVLVVSLMWIVINFVLDILYGIIDPRIRLNGGK